MKVAVACMKHIRDKQPVMARYPVDLIQHLWKPGARDDRILNHEIGSEAPGSAESTFAGGPQLLPFSVILGNPNRAGTVVEADLCDSFCCSLQACGHTVHLNDQECRNVRRKAAGEDRS